MAGRHVIEMAKLTNNKGLEDSNEELKRNCFMKLIATTDDAKFLDKFDKMVDRNETFSEGNIDPPKTIAMMEDEDIASTIEHVRLNEVGCKISKDRRNQTFQHETYFDDAFINSFKERSDFKAFLKTCLASETQNEKVDSIMKEHEQRVDKTSSYFQQRGLPQDQAKMASLSLSFYTGTKAGTSTIKDRANRINKDRSNETMSTDHLFISYNLLVALANIEYYKGFVFRSCQLIDEQLKYYKNGSLVMWTQFNGTFKGTFVENSFDFANKNTFFRIYSLTGRPIKRFSNFEDEDEVLFLPDTSFIVLKHFISHHGTQHHIYMRQVELGLSKSSVLWVDDQIFTNEWNNDEHMIYAESKFIEKNIRFIKKANTDQALSFLRSPFGRNLKNKSSFRIVTDMYRANEQPSENAGARFLKMLRGLGFENHCLAFVGDRNKSQRLINKELINDEEQRYVQVTEAVEDLRRFITFED